MAVRIAYGPPGQKGVSTIMGLGAEDVEPHPAEKMLGQAAWVGVGVWALGVLVNKPQVRGFGLGMAATGFGIKYLGDQDLAKIPSEIKSVAKPESTSGFFSRVYGAMQRSKVRMRSRSR